VPQKTNRDALSRERSRRARAERAPAPVPVAASRREAALNCAWCGGAIAVKATGRLPKWCSAACRQRAWEQSSAAASGRAAVQLVERAIATPVERVRMPRHSEWPDVLRELAAQLDDGRIYARELPNLDRALADVEAALHRQPGYGRPHRR
jgi:hypothetical protein